MTVFGFVFKLCSLRVYRGFELAYSRSLYNLRVDTLSQGVQTSRHLPRESGGVPTLPVPESERKERGQNWNYAFHPHLDCQRNEWQQRLTRHFDADFPSTADGTLFLVDPSKCIRFLSQFPVAFPCRILPIVGSLVVIKHLMEIPQSALLPFESSSMEHMFEGLKR